MFGVSFIRLVILVDDLQFTIAKGCRLLVGLESVRHSLVFVFHGEVFYQVYHLFSITFITPTKISTSTIAGEKLYAIFKKT
jgi:hypothetical protein